MLRQGELVKLVRERRCQDDCLAFIEQLGQLRSDVPKLLWDNAPPHHPKRLLEAAAQRHITFAWQPFRAPALNPCEDLWRLVKAVVAATAVPVTWTTSLTKPSPGSPPSHQTIAYATSACSVREISGYPSRPPSLITSVSSPSRAA
jgi:transposase